MPTSTALLIFPHQLFEEVLRSEDVSLVILVEDDLFFKQFKFHKQKLILHRASMREFEARLQTADLATDYIETDETASMTRLEKLLKKHSIESIKYYDVVDDWLELRLEKLIKKMKLERHILSSPAFLTNTGTLEDYFSNHGTRMQTFYEWQRKRLDVMVENGKPTGGRWSFDDKNRKPLPKSVKLPPAYELQKKQSVKKAKTWVMQAFPDNPGSTEFSYPATHSQAHTRLEHFLEQRLTQFGPYEDAIAADESELFHSVISPLINVGLLTPRQVVTRTLQYAKEHDVPVESLEGFIRQIIGWREYMRATYILHGRQMRTQNKLRFKQKLKQGWWDGTTGLVPVDTAIKRVLDTAYAHHIERLMVFGNAMLLLRIDPDEVYDWFMSLYIDAYDWVMVPNVYAMSQFAAGNMITTKPYISGSNYIHKMSDYKKADWSEVWDALYWRFIADHRELFEANPRSAMMVRLYDKLAPAKKQAITKLSNDWR